MLLGHKIQQQIEWRSKHSNEPSFEYSIAEE
jgi:hypothetical protein